MESGRVFMGLNAVTHPPLRAVVTVGMFDGVHVAHQRLVRSIIRLAQRLQGTSVVITFEPDPQVVLGPAQVPPALMPLRVRVAYLRALGAQWVWVIPFTKRFARMTAEQFIRRILVERLRASTLVVGEAFVFGRNRHGDMDLLQALGPRHGMRVIAVPPITRGGGRVSSSRIRESIRRGALAQARALLGRAPELYGEVVPGSGRGRRLGFPTANIRLASQAVPPQGVYAVLVRELIRTSLRPVATLRGPASSRPIGGGVMNFGVRPTFGPGPLVCEVHLPGFSGTLRHRSVSLSLLARLRGERRFSSPEALCRQIRRDLARARRVFKRIRR